MTIAAFLLALISALISIVLLRRTAFSLTTLDQPNHRSLHDIPTPRVGGAAMVIAALVTLAVLHPADTPLLLLFLAVCLALISLFDDRLNLPVTLRLAFHVAAAVLAASMFMQGALPTPHGPQDTQTDWPSSPWVAAAMVLAICWLTNLFNFMDGADGMAGGMAVIGFGAYAIAAAHAASLGMPQAEPIAIIAATLSGAAVGFLCFNFPPAKIFMGDTGSVPIGFLAATLGILGSLAGLWEVWFGAIIFSPFIVDATVTLTKRILRREKVWVAHREHYYQRLILSGWSHRKTVISYYLLMLGSALSALATQNSRLLYPTVTFWVITYSSLLLYLEWRFRQHKKD